MIDEAVVLAFPGTGWRAFDDGGMFQLQLSRPGLARWLDAAELSDGTLRFFCLCAALVAPKPPPLLVINEPETSLHPEVLPALAGLIAAAGEDSQILVVTHSEPLAEAIAALADCERVVLVNHEGETRKRGEEGARRVWTF